MAGTPSPNQRLMAVEQAFRSLPERYLGADPGFDATYHGRGSSSASPTVSPAPA